MNLIDDRNMEQRKTHTCLVIGSDTLLSGWGYADKGKSFAAWACTENDLEKVFRWVKTEKI